MTNVDITIRKMLIPLRKLSKWSGGDFHCCLHISIDDGNMDDFSLGFCYGYASAQKHELCSFIASWLHALPENERDALYEMQSLRDDDVPLCIESPPAFPSADYEEYKGLRGECGHDACKNFDRDPGPWHCEMPDNPPREI